MQHNKNEVIPQQASEITLAWLTSCLQQHHLPVKASLVAFHSTLATKQGMTSSVHILELQYDHALPPAETGHPNPRHLIAKFSSDQPQAQQALAANRGYQREFDFYQNFAAQTGPLVPFCYWSHYDPLTNRAGLLLEYVEDARHTSVYDGNIEDIRSVLGRLVPFHAKWWNQSAKLSSLCQGQDRFIVDPILAKLDRARINIHQHFRNEVGETLIALLEYWIPNARRLIAYEQQKPQTLCHGDLHRDQILFPRAADGAVRIIDWQMAARDSGAYDLAYLLITGLRPEQRTVCERAMVENYHAELLAHGVTDYPLEALWSSYRFSLARIAISFLSALSAPDIAPILTWWESDEKRKGISFWKATYQNISLAIDQHGVLEQLKQISPPCFDQNNRVCGSAGQ